MRLENTDIWFKIWTQPKASVRYVIEKKPPLVLIITTLLALWSNSAYTDAIPSLQDAGYVVRFFTGLGIVALDVIIIFILGKLLKGVANMGEVFIALALSYVPMGLYLLISQLRLEPLYLGGISMILSIWSLIMFIVMISEAEKISKKRGALITFIITLIFGVTLVSAKLNAQILADDINTSSYIEQLELVNSQEDDSDILEIYAENGYKYCLDDMNDFLLYNDTVLRLFSPDIEAHRSNSVATRMWTRNLTEKKLDIESFGPFFEQLKTLDKQSQDENSIWGKLAYALPNIYLSFMDTQLQHLLNQELNASANEADITASPAYLVSEIYREMADFCDESQNVYCDSLKYAEKSVQASGRNPNALFSAAYLSDDKTKNVEYLEKALAIVEVDPAYFDYSLDALYNNLGYGIYNDGQSQKYDAALHYLEKAYTLNPDSVYSLATMAGIYQSRHDASAQFEVLKKEAFNFFHSSDEALKEKDDNYWIFVRKLISTTIEFDDFNSTRYICKKYLELHDSEYEECNTMLKIFKQNSNDETVTAKYSYWPLYTYPKPYEETLLATKSSGAPGCGTVMKYKESLKYKMINRKKADLLRRFTKLYEPYEVPTTLKELIKFEERIGADSYVTSFFLDPTEKKEFFHYAFSDDEKINMELSKYFLPLANVDGTGGKVAFWIKDINTDNLENAPIIELGSEGHIAVVAKNIKDLLFMMSLGVESMDGTYCQYVGEGEAFQRREGFQAYRSWLKETLMIEPVEDWKVWGTPEKIEALEKESQKIYKKKFFTWLYTYIPDPEVETRRYEAEQFKKLSKEKTRLMNELKKRPTAETYCALAENSRQLRHIHKAPKKEEEELYIKALNLDKNNISALLKLAQLSRGEERLAYYKRVEKLSPDMRKIELYYKLALYYEGIKDDTNALKYYKKHIALNPRPNNYGNSDVLKLCKKLQLDPIALYEQSIKSAPNQLNYEMLFELYFKKGDYKSAMRTLEALFKVTVPEEYEYASWGEKFYNVDREEYALEVLKEGAKKLESPREKADLHTEIIKVYKYLENHTEVLKHQNTAIALYKEALQPLDDLNDTRKKIKLYVKVAELYEDLKSYPDEINNYKEAATLATDPEEESLYYYRIAESYIRLSDLTNALAYAKKSLALTPNDMDSVKQVLEIEFDSEYLHHQKAKG